MIVNFTMCRNRNKHLGDKVLTESALKSGTVLTSSGTGQMIRIPATQNIIGTLPGGKQVQYVRLVSTANSSTANVVSHTKPRTTTVFPVNAVTGVSAPKPVAITTVRNQPQALKVVPIAPATSAIRTARHTHNIGKECIREEKLKPEPSMAGI
ncbi:unnamed protein product [Timema podura]|uniref:Uncharacterized protein n=1 Tax=Timema podura TaxID=61482 RepID=A0ABN7NS49_TIMPD|nr:unnamed protein product [Timema podura]